MGYFLYIDGKKHDRNLISAIQALLDGKNAGKLDLSDANRIIKLFFEKKRFSITDRRTLKYLLAAFPWMENAKSFFAEKILNKPVSAFEKAEQIVEDEFGLHHLALNFDEEILASLMAVQGIVGFDQALRNALQSLLNDSHGNSFVSTIKKYFGITEVEKESNGTSLLDGIIADQLKHASLCVLPIQKGGQLPDYHEWPPNGEHPGNKWIFGLLPFELKSQYFWAVVDRNATVPAYNYGKVNLS